MGEIASSSPEIQRELDQLREWSADDRRVPRLIAPRTFVCAGILVASVVVGALLVHPKSALMLAVALAIVVSAAATLLSLLNDLVLIHARRLNSPGALAAYFFRCLKTKRWKAAAAAVSGHAGLDWQGGFVHDWRQRFGDAEIATVDVKEIQDVAVDMAYLRVRVTMKPGSPVEQVEVRKLAVLRRGRWYFVTGFSSGMHDRRLLRAIKGTGIYEPGDDWENETR